MDFDFFRSIKTRATIIMTTTTAPIIINRKLNDGCEGDAVGVGVDVGVEVGVNVEVGFGEGDDFKSPKA